LGQIIAEQIRVMHNHVKVMIQLINPNQHGPVDLPPVNHLNIEVHPNSLNQPICKDIAVEARATAQFMGTENFVSAMEMKVPTVKHIHINMALQQAQIADFYNELIRKKGWEHPPVASPQEQARIVQQFEHILHE
jgi:spore coat protein CotF